MINIFNLFLVLFASWILLSLSAGGISWFYVTVGLIVCAVVSITAWRIKVINRTSTFLFLNFGFYRHFIFLILSSFFKSIFLLVKLALNPDIKPIVFYIPIKKKSSLDLSLLISSITLIPGIMCLGYKDGEIIIHALDEKYLYRANLHKMYKELHKINDDRLV